MDNVVNLGNISKYYKNNGSLKVFETFAGIGAQQKAITNINKKYNEEIFRVVATSEWDIHCNISYDAIHNHISHKPKIKSPSVKKMRDFLINFQWSKDTKNPIKNQSFNNLDDTLIKKLYESVISHNNLGSIVAISGKGLIDKAGSIDVLTYSFPCQNLSTAGAFYKVNTGMKKGSKSRSGLLWEIERILLELKELDELPKYLILENVKAMLFKRNKPDYEKWVKALSVLGYKTNTQILNAKDFGVPQARERVFALSVLEKKNPKKKLMVSYEKKEMIPLNKIIKYNKQFHDEYLASEPNDTPSRIRMRENNPKLEKSTYCRTITTKQDRHPNCGTIAFPQGVKRKNEPWRFITPREGMILMGFESKDYTKLKNLKIKSQIAHLQIGNSLVVGIMESIFAKILELEMKND